MGLNWRDCGVKENTKIKEKRIVLLEDKNEKNKKNGRVKNVVKRDHQCTTSLRSLSLSFFLSPLPNFVTPHFPRLVCHVSFYWADVFCRRFKVYHFLIYMNNVRMKVEGARVLLYCWIKFYTKNFDSTL